MTSVMLLLLLESRACSDFVIGLTSPFLVLVMSVCSCVWRLFDLASVASDGFDDAAAIDKGKGGVSS